MVGTPYTGSMTTTQIPTEGERVEVPVLTGYKLVQNRPFECRSWSPDPVTGKYSSGCKCGECNGHTTVYEGTVERVIRWMDNSIEIIVACDDGETRRQTLVHPHGDVCF